MRNSGIGILFVILLQLAHAAPKCAEDCGELNEQSAQFDKSIKRLSEIKATNIAYIASLDTDQESQRMKANSNVTIADKRIAAELEKKHGLSGIRKQKKCDLCGEK